MLEVIFVIRISDPKTSNFRALTDLVLKREFEMVTFQNILVCLCYCVDEQWKIIPILLLSSSVMSNNFMCFYADIHKLLDIRFHQCIAEWCVGPSNCLIMYRSLKRESLSTCWCPTYNIVGSSGKNINMKSSLLVSCQ